MLDDAIERVAAYAEKVLDGAGIGFVVVMIEPGAGELRISSNLPREDAHALLREYLENVSRGD